MKLEIIGFNIEACIAAQEAGADRIELCASPGEGGTSPSFGFIRAAREKLHIDLYVMIRPRGGDFLYTDEEFALMKQDVLICKELGCDGIVTGILTSEGKVDKPRCNELINLAYPLEATFHRAFDRVSDPIQSLEDVIDCGFERILTSGLKPKAIDATSTLKTLVEQSQEKIIIMPGSGVNARNIIEIAEKTGATEFHSSASIYQESSMKYMNPEMNEELNCISVNKEEIQKMRSLLGQFSNK